MSKPLFKNLKHQYQVYLQNQRCCVCGMTNCEESIDHLKVTLEDINSLLNKKLQYQDKIVQIKTKVSEIYKDIKSKLICILQNDEYELQTYINKYNFSEDSSKSIDLNLISEIMEHNIQRLPTKKITKIMKKLYQMRIEEESALFENLKQKSQRLVQNFNFQAILSGIKPNLPSKIFKGESRQLKLKPKLSISQITNPQQADSIIDNKVYEWRNVRVTKNSRIVSLSNKNISDRQVMQQIPILSNYKNLKQFQIRNNKISCLTCNIIANNMPFLTSVDIRGNKISDKGIIKLINGIPKLKSFFISETLATDQTGEQVAIKLHDLEMFWSQHTKISNLVALKIAQKPKLKVLSFIGNPVTDDYKQKMKKIFISKGYIAI